MERATTTDVQIHAYCYSSQKNSFESNPATVTLTPRSIWVRTTHSGICFTDVHAKPKGCGLGHEGVGIVAGVGSAVSQFKIGDRVGWGWLHSSCGGCATCISGYRQYCAAARGFAFSDLEQGAFGDGRVIDAEFAYHIPAGIASEHAAPLMCAGASVYEALDAAGIRPYHRVGVVGVGGLGHLAMLFAKAMGCGVTAVSSGESKRHDSVLLGADEYFTTGQLNDANRVASAKRIDVLLITSNAVPELSKLLPILQRRATIVLMTIQQESLQVPYMEFILPGHRLIASTEASRENHIRMLEFAERHNIQPWIETFPMDSAGLAQAFGKLEQGDMRYRGVLVRPQQDHAHTNASGFDC